MFPFPFLSYCDGLCGDGYRKGTETCDDGNDNSTDGCADCVVLPGWACFREPIMQDFVVDGKREVPRKEDVQACCSSDPCNDCDISNRPEISPERFGG